MRTSHVKGTVLDGMKKALKESKEGLEKNDDGSIRMADTMHNTDQATASTGDHFGDHIADRGL